MDNKTVQSLSRLQAKINALRVKMPDRVNVTVAEADTIISDDKWSVTYTPDHLTIKHIGYQMDSRQTDSDLVLPDGITPERYGQKKYLLFKNGTGKPVNYLIPDDGLRLQRLENDRYHALNPIQDYIIEPSKELMKVEEANAEKMREYVRSMWTMLECPVDFKAEKDKASVSKAFHDSSRWHDLIVIHKYFTEARWNTDWELRSRSFNAQKQKIPKTGTGIIHQINEHFEHSHLAYEVKKKSPYTAPHYNEFWNKLQALKDAGMVD